jgi:hypothetical protein
MSVIAAITTASAIDLTLFLSYRLLELCISLFTARIGKERLATYIDYTY